MKQKNKKNIQRALGIIEGVWFCVSDGAQIGLTTAIEMIETVLEDEKDRKDGK